MYKIKLLSQTKIDAWQNQLKRGEDQVLIASFINGQPIINPELDYDGTFNLKGSLTLPRLNPNRQKDAKNAIKIYEMLADLDWRQANNSRLWTTLAIAYYLPYTQQRWLVAKDNVNQAKLVLRRCFYQPDLADRLFHNSIARLYWATKLTKRARKFQLDDHPNQSTEGDRARLRVYRYTHQLFNGPGYFQQIMQRKTARNNQILKALLKVLCQKDRQNQQLSKEQLVKLLKELDLVIGHRKIQSLQFQDLVTEISNLGNKLFATKV